MEMETDMEMEMDMEMEARTVFNMAQNREDCRWHVSGAISNGAMYL